MTRTSLRSMRRIAGMIVASFCLMGPASAIETFEGFDNFNALPSKGWNFQNLSNPLGDISWFQGDTEIFDAQAGPVNSYLGVNFDSVNGLGTISNWAITPMLTYSDGDTFSFYTRTEAGSTWPDRLEVRLSTQGNSSNVGSTATSVGDFTSLLLTVNPGLTIGGYPEVWTKYDITLNGLASPTTGRIAFRYFVTNGGTDGDFGDYIGIDTLRITTAVPEPSTWFLGGMACFAICLSRLRSRNSATR